VCGTVVALDMPVARPGQQPPPEQEVWVDVDGRGRVSSSSLLLQCCSPQVSHLHSLVLQWGWWSAGCGSEAVAGWLRTQAGRKTCSCC
jgi:hypothetical protein